MGGLHVTAINRWTLATLVVVLGLAVATPSQAQWKWRDKNGQTQYSDLPPPSGVPEQDILSRPNAASRRGGPTAAAAAPGAASAASAVKVAAMGMGASSPLTPRTVEPELEAKRKKAEAEQAAGTKAEDAKIAAAKAENCNRAKAQMRSLDSGVRIARTNEKGEREFLDDKARADESKRTREIISADCRPGL
jgi:hypothetical protein